MASGSKIWSVYSLAATVGAGIVAKKLLATSWKTATGKKPPANPAHPQVSTGEAVAWATVSGVSAGLARMLASRKAANYYLKSTGHLPPKMEDLDADG